MNEHFLTYEQSLAVKELVYVEEHKMTKKYAIVSTSYYTGDEWKSFHIVVSNLTEDDILKIKFYYDEYNRLWKECYEQEKENSKNGISKDLRTDLLKFLEKRIDNSYSINDYYKLWSEKNLIIEHFEIEN